MARIVFISPYLKGGRDAAHLAFRMQYFATRQGVELLRDENENRPATKNQQELVRQLLHSFPDSAELLEYEDYLAKPTRASASDFIEQVREQYIDQLEKRENYMDYIAHRPGVQKNGEHGLWDAQGKVQNLSAAVDEVANHKGNVWTPVVALRREDAERLGYDNAENWRALVNASICDIAKGYKIQPEHLRWYAAFHAKPKQVHIHMVVFSTEPRDGFLTKQGIREIKSAFAKQIYRQDLISVYEKQTEYRDTLGRDAEQAMAELIIKMSSEPAGSERLEQLTAQLAEGLKHTSGRKVYGYIPPRLKIIVDETVDELAKDERVASAYALWQEMRDEVCRTYDETLPPRLPLSKQKEFKPVRNMVIREAMKLSEAVFTFEDDAMDDEPEHVEQASAAPEPTTRPVYRQAADYRQTKRILSDEYASPEERSAALTMLESLWTEGFSIAAHQLGKAYRDGIFVTENAESAKRWFRLSADAGNDCSEYALGKLLLTQDNPAEAVSWLKRAAGHQNQYAHYRLGKLYLLGEAVPKNIEAALKHLTTAARQGNQYAQYTLGKLYLLGREVEQDKETAARWFTLSAAQGNPYARFFLDRMAQFRDPSVGMAVLRMFYHMSRIFNENATADNIYQGIQIDKKRRRKLQQKRIAAGHKPDDHEDPQMIL